MDAEDAVEVDMEEEEADVVVVEEEITTPMTEEDHMAVAEVVTVEAVDTETKAITITEVEEDTDNKEVETIVGKSE